MNSGRQHGILNWCGTLSGVLAGLLLFAVPAARAAGQQNWTWERYQPILDRAPFGKAPGGRGGAMSEAELAALAAAEAEEGPALAEIVKLSVITRYDDLPAAGFKDTTTGRSFYLFEGESVEDFTLLLVDAPTATVWLRKGTQEAALTLGAQPSAESTPPESPSVEPTASPGRTRRQFSAGSGGPQSSRGAVQPDSSNISYSALQRRRAEEAQKRAEEESRKAEEERKQQEERLAKLTGEALQKHLREYNLEMIRTGKGAALPIELTPEEVEQLAAEGYDVTRPPSSTPSAPALTVSPPDSPE